MTKTALVRTVRCHLTDALVLLLLLRFILNVVVVVKPSAHKLSEQQTQKKYNPTSAHCAFYHC